MKRIRKFANKLLDVMHFIFNRLLDVICFVLGPFFLTMGMTGRGSDSERCAVGVALICFGLLRKYWQRSSKPT